MLRPLLAAGLAAALAVACTEAPPADISNRPSVGAFASGDFKKQISGGERVTLADHAPSSGRTVFEFMAPW